MILNLINVGPLNKDVGPEKKSKLINVGPTFIPESRVVMIYEKTQNKIPEIVSIDYANYCHRY